MKSALLSLLALLIYGPVVAQHRIGELVLQEVKSGNRYITNDFPVPLDLHHFVCPYEILPKIPSNHSAKTPESQKVVVELFSPFNDDRIILEVNALANSWQLILFQNGYQKEFSSGNFPLADNQRLIPWAWISEDVILFEILQTNSAWEHRGVLSLNLSMDSAETIAFTWPQLFAPGWDEESGLLYFPASSAEKPDFVHGFPNVLGRFDLRNNRWLSSVFPGFEFIPVGWLCELDSSPFGERNIVPGFNLPWPEGIDRCVTRDSEVTDPPGDPGSNTYCSDLGYHGYFAIDFDTDNFSDELISAVFEGTVVQAWYAPGEDGYDVDGYGNFIRIEHPDGYYSLYAHLKSLSVDVGDYVEKGCIIGIEGNTGYSFGDHLHWEYEYPGGIGSLYSSFDECNCYPHAGYIYISENAISQTCSGCGEAVLNDACATAIAINSGQCLSGSVCGASQSYEPDNCSGYLSSRALDVFYRLDVPENGNFIIVADPEDAGAGAVDAVIQLLLDDCNPQNALVCEDSGGGAGAAETIEIFLTAGTYYIRIYDYTSNNTDPLVTNFSLCVSSDICPVPDNDLCESAIEVFCGNLYQGNTECATADSQEFCFTSITAPGVWYRIQGTGTEIQLEICSAGTDYDTKLHVFSGNCNELNCVAGNDDFECEFDPFHSYLSFNSQLGEEYFILVSGFGEQTGQFSLQVNCPGCWPAAANDSCEGAISLAPGECQTGTVCGAGQSFSPSLCSGYLSAVAKDIFYTFNVPVEGEYSLSVDPYDDGLNAVDAVVQLMSGACDPAFAIACEDSGGGAGASEIITAWLEPGTYYVRVYDYTGNNTDPATTLFTICLEAPECAPPANDLCANAVNIVCGESIVGTTVCAAAEVVEGCETPLTAAGVWYSAVGSGYGFNVSLCHESTNYDTKLHVFTGNCENLVCIRGNDDSPCVINELFSELDFESVAGEIYYLLVSGYGDASGSFNFELSCSSCAADINGDFIVNANDLLAFLAGYGCQPPALCSPSDIDGNGETNSGDLLLLLAAMGANC